MTISQTPWVCAVRSVDLIEHNLHHLLNPFLKAGSPISLAGAATTIIFVTTKEKHVFVMTKHVFCCNKSTLAMKKLLSWQNENLLWQNVFVVTKLLLWQIFVATNMCLSQQNYVKMCFVMTNTCLSQETCVSHDKRVCHDNTTKILVAAPANDSPETAAPMPCTLMSQQ